MQVIETKNKTNNEDDLKERENFTGKNWFLSWVGDEDYHKEKVLGNYAIKLIGSNVMETKQNKLKVNHYKYMKQKVISKEIKDKNKKFQDFLVEWDKKEDTEGHQMLFITCRFRDCAIHQSAGVKC